MPGNWPAWFGPGVAGKGPVTTAGTSPAAYRCALSHHSLIERIPRTHRYRVTGTGLHSAMILTRLHDRVLPAALAQTHRDYPHPPGKLRAAATAYQQAIDGIIHEWTPTGFVDTIRSGTMVYEERTGSGTGSQEVHPGI